MSNEIKYAKLAWNSILHRYLLVIDNWECLPIYIYIIYYFYYKLINSITLIVSGKYIKK